MMPTDRMASVVYPSLLLSDGTHYQAEAWTANDGSIRCSVDFDPGRRPLLHPGSPGRAAGAGRGPGSRRDAAEQAEQPSARRRGWPADVARHPPDEVGCPACATGWHTRCTYPDLADDGDGELVERCCDGLLIARRRRPLWTR